MKKYIFIISASLILSGAAIVLAANFPIRELGNCRSEQDCAVYCDDFSHLANCLSYAKKNDLMSPEELKEAEIVLPFMQKLGCSSRAKCQELCQQDKNLMTCVELGYRLGDVSKQDYEMMKKTGGKGPGGCKMEECETYCDGDEHLIECVDFAVQNGIMDPAEAAIVKKVGTTKGPGDCRGKAACDAFCAKPENEKVCLEFGAAHGLISPETAEILLGAGSTKKADVINYCNLSDDIHYKCQKMLLSQGEMTEFQVARENRVMAFARKNCGVTRWDWGAIEKCGKDFCSKDENMEECLKYEISIGERTRADYDAWLKQKEESEKKDRGDY